MLETDHMVINFQKIFERQLQIPNPYVYLGDKKRDISCIIDTLDIDRKISIRYQSLRRGSLPTEYRQESHKCERDTNKIVSSSFLGNGVIERNKTQLRRYRDYAYRCAVLFLMRQVVLQKKYSKILRWSVDIVPRWQNILIPMYSTSHSWLNVYRINRTTSSSKGINKNSKDVERT